MTEFGKAWPLALTCRWPSHPTPCLRPRIGHYWGTKEGVNSQIEAQPECPFKRIRILLENIILYHLVRLDFRGVILLLGGFCAFYPMFWAELFLLRCDLASCEGLEKVSRGQGLCGEV